MKTTPAKIALIGHRGVGKTTFLRCLEKFDRKQQARFWDLDEEIEIRARLSIQEIFANFGETFFRQMELETFQDLHRQAIQTPSTEVISLGAGFDPQEIPRSWHTVWLRRPSDEEGRVFDDRPRLHPEGSALEEFQRRFLQRQPHLEQRADEILWLKEGLENTILAAKAFWSYQEFS